MRGLVPTTHACGSFTDTAPPAAPPARAHRGSMASRRGDDARGKRRGALAVAGLPHRLRDRRPHRAQRQIRIGREVLHHHGGRHRLLALMPDVVVGDHGHHAVAKLRLAGQPRLGQRGHADHVHAPGAVELGFGASSKTAAPRCRHRRRPDGRFRPAPSTASARTRRTRAHKGSAMPTCTTRPGSSKNVEGRARVRSMSWSGITTSSGGNVFAQCCRRRSRPAPTRRPAT